MVRLKQIDTMQLQIHTNDIKYFNFMKDEFTRYVPNYQFMPKYRAGMWNGKTSMISDIGVFPYGLLFDYVRVHKKNFPDVELKVDDEIKSIFKGKEYKLIENLKLKPYPYQKDCIERCLKYTKGIIVSATASGKSNVISYIVKTLLENGFDKFIVVVPTISLVEQFHSDMVDYGIDYHLIGKVHSNSKQWGEQITISTWQTLKNNHDKLKEYQVVIIDECLHPKTNITMFDGSKKQISEIKIGDKIISYNIEKNIFEEDFVEDVYKNMIISENEKMYELKFDNGKTIKITGNHKILTNNGYKRSDEITENDEIFDLNI